MGRLRDLYKRTASATLIGGLVLCLIVLSSLPVVSWLLWAAVSVLAGVGVWEYARLAAAKALGPAPLLMGFVAVGEITAFFVSEKFALWRQAPAAVLFAGGVLCFLSAFHKAAGSIARIAVQFFGVCYVAVPLGFLLGIAYLPSQDGKWWLLYLISVAKVTDIGGYFVGRLWGKRLLAPVLSPKKTVEGALAGFLCAVLVSAGWSLWGTNWLQLSWVDALWLGVSIGLLGQVGDLAESLLKRDAAVKDSNRLPGLGGVLDMIDSLLLTAPVLYFFLHA
jgi:phosphatidate cytidylyltransferase